MKKDRRAQNLLNARIRRVPLKTERVDHCLNEDCKKTLKQGEMVTLVSVEEEDLVDDSNTGQFDHHIFCSRDCWDSVQHTWLEHIDFY